MSSLSVRLPESLHNSLREISKKDHVSINQFISSAVAEKITALETEKYLETKRLIARDRKTLREHSLL